MALFRQVGGKRVQLSAAEEADVMAERAAWVARGKSQPPAELGDVWEALKAKIPQLTDADLPPGKKPPRVK